MVVRVTDPNVVENDYDPTFAGLGDTAPGWSATIDSTPHVLGDSTGGTGTINFTADEVGESDLLFARDIRVQADNVDMQGKINSADVDGNSVKVVSDTILARLNAQRYLPPVDAGTQIGSINYSVKVPTANTGKLTASFLSTNLTGLGQIAIGADTLYNGGAGYLTNPSTPSNATVGTLGPIGPSMFVTLSGGAFGAMYVYSQDATSAKITEYFPGGSYATEFGSKGTAAGQFNKVLAIKDGPTYFYVLNFDGTNYYIQWYALNGTYTGRFQVAGTPFSGAVPSSFAIDNTNSLIFVAVQDPTTKQSSIWKYSITGTYSSTSGPISATGMFLDLEFDQDSTADLYAIETLNTATPGANVSSRMFRLRGAFPTPAITTVSTLNVSNPVLSLDTVNELMYVLSYEATTVLDATYSRRDYTVRVVPKNIEPSTLRNTYYYYLLQTIEEPFYMEFDATDRTVSYPGVSGSVWDFVKQLATATNTSVAAGGSTVFIQDTLDNVGNYSAIDQSISGSSPDINLTGTSLSRKVGVTSQGTHTAIQDQPEIFYDAATDGNGNTISVDVGQSIVVNVQTRHWPVGLVQPLHWGTSNLDNAYSPYCYTIQDSEGNVLLGGDWEDLGGSISVSISNDGQGVELYITGPTGLSGPTGSLLKPPFSFVQNRNKTPALQIYGWGVKTDPETLTIYTGADEEFVTEDMGASINNPYIENVEQGYDQGAWATHEASGPQMRLTFKTPPFSSVYGFNTRVSYNKMFWRVISHADDAGGTAYTCAPYSVVQDFENLWQGAEQRRNIILVPLAEGWVAAMGTYSFANGQVGITIPTSALFSGTSAIQLSVTTAANSGSGSINFTPALDRPLVAGESISVAYRVAGSGTGVGKIIQPQVIFYTKQGGSVVGSTQFGTTVTLTSSAQAASILNKTVPSGATYATFGFNSNTTTTAWAVGATVLIGDITASPGATAVTPFNGNMASTTGTTYHWLGTPNLSATTLTSGYLVSDYDAFWSGYRVYDQKVRPLWGTTH